MPVRTYFACKFIGEWGGLGAVGVGGEEGRGKKFISQKRATTFVPLISSYVILRKEYDIAGGVGTYTWQRQIYPYGRSTSSIFTSRKRSRGWSARRGASSSDEKSGVSWWETIFIGGREGRLYLPSPPLPSPPLPSRVRVASTQLCTYVCKSTRACMRLLI